MTITNKKQTFKLKWKYSGSIPNETLGRNMYSKAITALGELISNSLDAGSRFTEIDLSLNDLGVLETIVIRDNGIGISRERMLKTFAEIGNKFKQEKPDNPHGRSNIGRKGIGRFAVYRLGSISEWETISQESQGLTKYKFKLDASQGDTPPEVTSYQIKEKAKTGTTIRIYNIDETTIDKVFQDDNRLRLAIFSQFPVYLFQYPDVVIKVNGTPIVPNHYAFSKEPENICFKQNGDDHTAEVTHVFWNPGVKTEEDTVLVFSSAGRIIFEEPISVGEPDKKYTAFVESPIIDGLVSSNRETMIWMDPVCQELKSKVIDCCREFVQKSRSQESISFIERARKKDYYPYTSVRTMPEHVSQMVYDQFLKTLNSEVNLETATQKQQKVIFRLLKRALESHDIISILDEVSSLTDDDAKKKFREVLEHVTLSSVIQVSSMLSDRIAFLDDLHELVYGRKSMHVKERKQLHKLLEPHTWLFGEQYNLATSDQSFRKIVSTHREQVQLPELSSDEISQIKDVNKIPDLFLASQKFEEFEKRYHNLIIELKAPKVPINAKAFEQVKGYARTIINAGEFDKNKTIWEIFLISSEIHDDIKDEFQKPQDGRPGVLIYRDDYRIFARTWGEIESERRAELDFITQYLQKKTRNMEELEYFRKKFGDLFPQHLDANDDEVAKRKGAGLDSKNNKF